jgi:tetratricopeptide (TPR) repeat protein
VRYIIDRYGLDALKGILRDLGTGMDINKAIAEHTEDMAKLETDFAAYAKGLAHELAPNLDWKRPDPELLEPGAEQKYAEWVSRNAENYWAIRSKTRELIDGKRWADAQTLLEHSIQAYPNQIGPESPYLQLASVYRALDEEALERTTLAKLVQLDPNATDACLRLMELEEKVKDWAAVKRASERFLQVNPLVVPPYRYLAESSQQLGETANAIAADRTLLQLGPPNPVEVHFQLAQLLHHTQDPEARRQVLQALEDAPRYRDALALLLDIHQTTDSTPAPKEPLSIPKPSMPVPLPTEK